MIKQTHGDETMGDIDNSKMDIKFQICFTRCVNIKTQYRY